MSTQRMGHKKQVGEWFESQTKRMIKQIRHINDEHATLIYRRPGDRDYFQHKGRRYYCEVLGCIERRSGWYFGVWDTLPWNCKALDKRVRWWQFTYVVRILEN